MYTGSISPKVGHPKKWKLREMHRYLFRMRHNLTFKANKVILLIGVSYLEENDPDQTPLKIRIWILPSKNRIRSWYFLIFTLWKIRYFRMSERNWPKSCIKNYYYTKKFSYMSGGIFALFKKHLRCPMLGSISRTSDT